MDRLCAEMIKGVGLGVERRLQIAQRILARGLRKKHGYEMVPGGEGFYVPIGVVLGNQSAETIFSGKG